MPAIVLVTGANRGIGLALTKELLAHDCHVIAAARAPEESAELKQLEMIHHDAITLARLDVTSDASVEGVVEALAAQPGRIDVLVNNAAVFPEQGNERLEQMRLEHFREAFETNVIGVVRMVRAFLPLLEKGERPRVVNISSGAGSISEKEDYAFYAYSTSKAALNMATRAMAAELKERGICVVALTPGWVKTDMGGPNAPLTPEQSARAIAKTIEGLTLEQAGGFLERTGEKSSAW
jgi:NAD(P)-dependent dehydrogenase (short-subunit alcohol dehydrogenase family)